MPHVIKNIKRADEKLIQKFASQSSATIHEALGRKGAINPHIKPIYPGMKVCGSALTVSGHGGDNLMLHKAIAVAKPGDVIVATVHGSPEFGYWGFTMSTSAKARGIAGLVINGCVRDGEEIRELGFPIFARGLCIRGTVKETIGYINHPISFEGVLVNPGDIILGDDDGLVVVSQDEAAHVLQNALRRVKREKELVELLKTGKMTLELSHYDEVLSKKGLTEE